MELRLSEPEKTASGFLIRVSQKPALITKWEGGKWKNDEELLAVIMETRRHLIDMLYEKRSSWFSSVPTKSQLTKLMKGWDTKNLAMPSDTSKNYSGSQTLTAVQISNEGIFPRWTSSVWQLDEVSKISMPWTQASDDELEEIDDSREINIDVDSAPVKLNHHEDRNYLDRKFAAKERVKEARLKAQVAKKMAFREINFFFENFTLDDDESTFSDYDLTDNEDDEYEEEEEVEVPPHPVRSPSRR
jgi:hypothetical protein